MESTKKFRYTKQLIAMSLRDGWTQQQIAAECRTQQSIVSSWKSGAAQAKTGQLAKLLAVYGPRLRRKAFRIYHDFIDKGDAGLAPHLIRVEGNIILSFPFRNKTFCVQCHSESETCACRQKGKKILPTQKLIVHAMGEGIFCCLHQRRLLRDKFQMQFPETNLFCTKVVGNFTSQELLDYFDTLEWATEQDDKVALVAERLMLRLLARKALLEHGYPVDNVEEHCASW